MSILTTTCLENILHQIIHVISNYQLSFSLQVHIANVYDKNYFDEIIVCPVFLIRPEFFYFSFYQRSRPNFLKIEKKNKRFFSILVLYFPLTHASKVLEFNYVFFILSFLLQPG